MASYCGQAREAGAGESSSRVIYDANLPPRVGGRREDQIARRKAFDVTGDNEFDYDLKAHEGNTSDAPTWRELNPLQTQTPRPDVLPRPGEPWFPPSNATAPAAGLAEDLAAWEQTPAAAPIWDAQPRTGLLGMAGKPWLLTRPGDIIPLTPANNPPPARTLTTNSAARKALPICTGVLDYFPDALADVARLSKIGNEKHNPGEPLHWQRDKSTDHADCIIRHQIDRGTIDTDGLLHDAKVAWRALAQLQLAIEKLRAEGVPYGVN